MRRLLVGSIAIVGLLWSTVPASAAPATASVAPHRKLVDEQTVTVSWHHFLHIVKGDTWVNECLPTWQSIGYEAACDQSGVALREQHQAASGSLQTQVIKGDLVDDIGDPIGTCGTKHANNDCVILVQNLNRVTRKPINQVAVPIKFSISLAS